MSYTKKQTRSSRKYATNRATNRNKVGVALYNTFRRNQGKERLLGRMEAASKKWADVADQVVRDGIKKLQDSQ